AEQRVLPAAEGVEGHWNRDRHVDADHSHLDTGGEVARGVTVAREDGDAVGIVVPMDEIDRLGIVAAAHYRQHRAEDLLPPDRHLRPHVIEERRADEEAILVALRRPEATAIDAYRRAFRLALADQPPDPLHGRLRHHRPHFGLG